MVELIFKPGTDEEERFELSKEVSSIGRDEDCDVILPDTSVSRHHAFIFRVDQRLYRIEDHDSSNGTLVNGETVVNEFLNDGDQLEIGCYTLVFKMSTAPSTAPKPAAQQKNGRSSQASAAPQRPTAPPSSPAPPPAAAKPASSKPSAVPPQKAPVPGQRPATILVLDAGKVIHEQAVLGETFTIGSKPGCDLVLTDSRVSKEHAQLVYHDGEYFLEDLESLGGTYCNHERIISKELKSGDELSIGRYVLVFEIDNELEMLADTIESAAADLAAAASTQKKSDSRKRPAEVAPPKQMADLSAATRKTAVPSLPPDPPPSRPASDRARPASERPQPTQPPTAKSAAQEDTLADLQSPPPALEPTSSRKAIPLSSRGRATPRLHILMPGGQTLDLLVNKPEMTIGRLPSNDLVLEDDSISRVHARLRFEKGILSVRDQDSLNGVQIGGKFVEESEIKPGEVFILGEIRLEFREDATKPEAESPQRKSAADAATIYDAVPGASEAAQSETLADVVLEETDPLRSPAGEPPRRTKGKTRRSLALGPNASDAESDSDHGMRNAETLYEAPAREAALFGQMSDETSGPLDKLRGVYEKLGPSPKQRKMRAVLGLLILAGIASLFVIDPSPPAQPIKKPTDRSLSEQQGTPTDAGAQASQSDAARLARINQVQEATTALETQDWDGALSRVESVLEAEPSNVRALSIRDTARQEKEVEGKLAKADELFKSGRSAEAQELLGTVAPQSVYYALAESRRKDAQNKNLDRLLTEATRLRDQKKYTEALTAVRKALDLAPESTAAKALAKDIEKRRNQPERTGPSPEERAAATAKAEEQKKTQALEAETTGRQALQRSLEAYASGDPEGAESALQPLLSAEHDSSPLQAQARSQSAQIQKAAQHYRAARAAQQSNQTEAALAQWKSLLETDKALLGGKPSQWRQEASLPFATLLTGQADQLYAAGKESGELAAAYQKYKEALGYVPGHAPAKSKVESIEREAIELYRLAYGRWESDPEGALGQVEKVLQILPAGHEYARRAQILRDKIKGR